MTKTPDCHQEQPTFILCIGSPKAGTTWLHHYLASFECADLGFKKEYHVFDTVYLEDSDHFLPRKDFNGSSSKSSFRQKQAAQESLLESFRDNHNTYFDYFASLYSDNITISADITPNYMGLPADVLSMISSGFKQRGIQTKVVFILRDPISRLISAAKMAKRLGLYAGKRFNRNSSASTILNELCELPNVISNLNYRDTLCKLDSVFDQQNLHIAIYESMFSMNELDRLSSFLGLPPKPEWLSRHFNQASTSENEIISPVFPDSLKKILSEQYAYCFSRFPGLARNEQWSSHSEIIV